MKIYTSVAFALSLTGAALGTLPRSSEAASSPLDLYRLAPSVAGKPQHYFGEGGGCGQPCPTETYTPGRGSAQPTVYYYGVTPNVAIRKTPERGGVEAYYTVSVYTAVETARKVNLAALQNANLDGTTPAPLLPISAPVASNEWLRGHVIGGSIPNQCSARAGVRHGNSVIDAYIINYASANGQPAPCSAEYHWATRVLTALYGKVVATH